MNHIWCSHNSWTSYLVTWWAGIKVYMWFSANRNKKVALQILTLPNSQAHEKWFFLIQSNGWTSHNDYWQFLTVITVFVGIFAICRKMTLKHILGCIGPSWQQKYLRDGSFFDDDDSALSFITGQVWTVTNAPVGCICHSQHPTTK